MSVSTKATGFSSVVAKIRALVRYTGFEATFVIKIPNYFPGYLDKHRILRERFVSSEATEVVQSLVSQIIGLVPNTCLFFWF